MVKRNPHFIPLQPYYLFPEIQQRKQRFLEQHPNAQLLPLSIGDTTEPIPSSIAKALEEAASRLGTLSGYSGYGPEQGHQELRKKIADKIYHHQIHPDEIFISDGTKCDIGRLQLLFGPHVSIAIQDPCYPVYLDGSILQGVQHIHLLPCVPQKQFFPSLSSLPKIDLLYFCSPNNPTGEAATKEQLEQLLDCCRQQKAILLFDSAYSSYIQDPQLPKSIFEISGARESAIEMGSFSKIAGFTGIRLGWTVIPEELKFEEGGSVKADWKRLTSTVFNGASNIAQAGGCAVLESEGWHEVQSLARFYMENASLLRDALEKKGYAVFGGIHAPYLWVHFPGRTSWDVFQEFLEKFHILTTPGSGFGPHGEEFVRFSAFGHRSTLLEAIERLR